MSIAALFAWLLTIFGGLILLMIWIIEYDSEFQSAAATRLPVPVISAHALLGMGGLVLWLSYILIDQERLAWASVAVWALSPSWAWSWRHAGSGCTAPSLTPACRLRGNAGFLQNGTSRCRSSSLTASWPSPPSFWCCFPRLAETDRHNRTAWAHLCAGARSGRCVLRDMARSHARPQHLSAEELNGDERAGGGTGLGQAQAEDPVACLPEHQVAVSLVREHVFDDLHVLFDAVGHGTVIGAEHDPVHAAHLNRGSQPECAEPMPSTRMLVLQYSDGFRLFV